MKAVAILLVLVTLSLSVAGQKPSSAVKVSELADGESNDSFVIALRNFLKRLRGSHKSTTGFIAIHDNVMERWKIVNDTIRPFSSLKRRIWVSRPASVYRPSWPVTEFWLLPKGTEPPYKPFIVDCTCPTIFISDPLSADKQNWPLHYTANISGSSQDTPVSYKWIVKNGKIVDGQGTPSIRVRPNPGAKSVAVEVRIGGMDEDCLCVHTASSLTQLPE